MPYLSKRSEWQKPKQVLTDGDISTYGNFSNESTGIYFLYPRNFIIKLLSGGFSQQGIEQAGD